MQERDPGAAASGTRMLVDERCAARVQLLDRGVEVVDAEGDVMQRRAPTLHETLDNALTGRLEQLEAVVAGGEHALGEARRLFGRDALQSERRCQVLGDARVGMS